MKKAATLLLLMALVSIVQRAFAYDPETHRNIAERAADAEVSLIDEFLKEDLALSKGVEETFLAITQEPKTVRQLLGDGAFFEDIPATRSLNHFHNPLVDPWSEAGLRASSIFGVAAVRGQSSVLWQQNLGQEETIVFTPIPLTSGGGTWAWHDARQRFLEALTNPPKADSPAGKGRDTAFAELFETLGHLTHLIQDATVPAHVRNDAHPPFVRPDPYEKWVERARGTPLFSTLLGQPPKKPLPSIFTPTPHAQAPAPIARLIDTDMFLGGNTDVLGGENAAVGAAEYVNGNFLSRGTRFRRFLLPRPESLDPGPIEEIEPGKFRRYFTKTRDGAAITRFATEGLLHESLVAARGAPLPTSGWMLDDRVHEDYASDLLPRAVGYSAGLLDYFFRGKLDLGFDSNPSDATGSLITVSNRSEDTVGPGMVQLYADDLLGNRMRVAEASVGEIARDQPLTTFPITRDVEAQPLTAVFRGTLGQEPDAVIGKIGGRAVEQFFKGPTDWMLRTADGIFPLGLGTAPGRLKWGDADNLLLAQSFLPANDMQFQVYRINRPEGSSAVPLRADPQDPASPVVDLVPVGPPLRLGASPVDLETTVHYRRTHNYRQHLLTFHVKEEVSVGEGAPVGLLTLERRDVLSVEPTVPFAQAFAIDETFVPHTELPFFTTARPYGWFVNDVFVSREGEVLALVQVSLNQRLIFVPVHAHDAQGVVGPTSGRRAVSLFSPSIQVLHFLVNLTQRTVMAKSSADVVTLTFTTEDEFTEVDALITHISAEGEEQGSEWVYPYNFSLYAGTTQAGDPPVVASEPGAIGSSEWSLPGLHRPELVAAGFVDSFTVVRQDETTITKVPGGRKQAGAVAAIAFMTTVYDIPPPAPLGIVGLVRASHHNRFALLGWIHTQNVERWVPYRWAPAQGAVTRLAGLDIPTDLPSDVSLLSANTESALLLATVTTQPLRILERTVRLVTEPREFTFLDRIDLRYRLLGPYWLFNVEDLRFHRVSAELEPLEGPRPLVAGGPTAGEYHVTGRTTP